MALCACPLGIPPALSDDYLPKGEDRGKFTLHAVLLHGRPDVPEMSAQRKVPRLLACVCACS